MAHQPHWFLTSKSFNCIGSLWICPTGPHFLCLWNPFPSMSNTRALWGPAPSLTGWRSQLVSTANRKSLTIWRWFRIQLYTEEITECQLPALSLHTSIWTSKLHASAYFLSVNIYKLCGICELKPRSVGCSSILLHWFASFGCWISCIFVC